MSQREYTTKVLHTPFIKKDVHNALHMPVYDNASFEFDNAEDMELAFTGRKPAHSYSRITNPTVEHLEQIVKSITGAQAVTAVASGMAAISNTFIAAFRGGDHIVASGNLFGNTRSLFNNNFSPLGMSFSYANFSDIASVEAAIRPETKALFFETITNPQLEVADISALAELAQRHGLLVIADSTVTPPYIFDGKAAGVHIELVSSTKFMSGGATSVGGLIIDHGTYNWAQLAKFEQPAKQFGPMAFSVKLKREVFRNLGACLSPHNAYLQSLGLETLGLRLDRAVENSLAVANFLKTNAQVKAAHYPGLVDNPHYALVQKQFGGKGGSVVCFELETKDQCYRLLNNLKLIKRSTNLNDNKTLIIHPASTIFSEYSPEQRAEMGVGEGLIRLSLGIEGAADIIADLQQALQTI